MKKNLILLMLGFTFSFNSFAGNDMKEVKNDLLITKSIEKGISQEQKKFTGFCLEVYAFSSFCPDGTEYLAAVDVFIVDCDTGVVYAGATVYQGDYDANCN